MKEITLRNGMTALVDASDYELVVANGPWRAHPGRHTFYATRHVKHSTLRMHRVILGLTNPKIIVDHRDRNGLNNCRANLRIATHGQNAANRRKRDGSSQFRGVSWFKPLGKWCARIGDHGRDKHLGYFSDEVAAALAYDRAALEHFGGFANLNFPPKKPAVSDAALDVERAACC